MERAHATRSAALALLACAACQEPAPHVPEPASAPEGASDAALDLSADFELAPGMRATLWAQSPLLHNPTAIDVDARGRVWVAQAINYRQWQGRNPGRHDPAGDRIVILEDRDGDGSAETSTVFVQDEELVAPLGICVDGERVIVSCSPSVFIYHDDDGDDRADRRETFLTGFGGHDHDHGLHSFVVGPDGRYYFTVGNAGPHVVTDRSGWTLRSGSLYRGGGEFESDNVPGLASDDGRVHVGGLVLRVERDGTHLEVLAHNFRNQYEVALDAFGNLYVSDNDDDGNQSCRTVAVVEGGNYGYCSADGSRAWSWDRRPGQATATAHWHQDDPGVMPAGTITGAGGPTGVAVYEGGLFGPDFDGTLLAADAGRSLVYAQRATRRGAGLELAPGMLIAARSDSGDERAHDFRPSDVAVGPDGTIYVSDWSDPGVGGHWMGDREAYGRILRIVPRDAAAPRAPASPARAAARALWTAARAGDLAPAHGVLARSDADPELRLCALRARGDAHGIVLGPLSPAERCTAALEARRAAGGAALPLDFLRTLAEGYDGRDRTYLEVLGTCAAGREAELYAALRAEQGDPAQWSERFADLAWRLHPPEAIADLAARAGMQALAPERRRQAVDALAFIPERAAAEAMVALALAGPDDVRELARWWVEQRDTNDWSAFHLAEQIEEHDPELVEERFASGIVSAGSIEIDADVSGAHTLWLVATTGARGESHDWVDWIDPRLIGPEGELHLTDAPWIEATTGWGDVERRKNTEGGPLSIRGKRFEHGIGTHAYSQIGWRVPKGTTRFRATAGIDDGGALQPGARPDVEFKVLVEREVDREALRAAAIVLGDSRSSPEAVERAADELCADRHGVLLLISLGKNEQLPAPARKLVGQRLSEHPDPALRALAAEAFPVERRAAAPEFAAIERLEPDPRAGAALFFGARASCSTCHAFHGKGGDLGPDLTAIAAKYGPRELLHALLEPSAAIAFGYDAWTINTRDDRIVSGFLLADAEHVVVRDTAGRRHVFDKDEIATRTKHSVSTMPADVARDLAPQELADLLAFLRSDPKRPGTRGAPRRLFNGRDLAGWTFHLADPAARMQDVWSVEGGVLACKGNPIGYLRTEESFTSFELSLEWRFPPGAPPGNSGVLLRMQGPDKVWPRSIEAQLQHKNAGDIWNIDAFEIEVDEARTDGRHTGKRLPCNEKPLGEWNRYVITLDGGELTLAVNGEVQNRASWCAELPGKICLQSEGAAIEFREIVLVPMERATGR